MTNRLSAEERGRLLCDGYARPSSDQIAQAIKDAEQVAADAARRRAWDLAFCEAHAPADLRVDPGTGLVMEDLPGGWQEWEDPCCVAIDAFERGRREERTRDEQLMEEAGREVIAIKHKLQELTLPITDKSVCSRGHPGACLVEVRAEAPDGSMQGYAVECSACTQMNTEFGWGATK